jgi:hypothetical protein
MEYFVYGIIAAAVFAFAHGFLKGFSRPNKKG